MCIVNNGLIDKSQLHISPPCVSPCVQACTIHQLTSAVLSLKHIPSASGFHTQVAIEESFTSKYSSLSDHLSFHTSYNIWNFVVLKSRQTKIWICLKRHFKIPLYLIRSSKQSLDLFKATCPVKLHYHTNTCI